MTETATHGLAEAASAAFVNGSTQPAAARPSAKVRTTRTNHRDEPRQDEPSEAMPAWSPIYWRHAFLTSCRMQEVLHGGYVAIVREQLAFAELAGREALETGQALLAEADGDRRTRLLSDYLREGVERTMEHSALLLELCSRPGSELLQILAEAGAPPA